MGKIVIHTGKSVKQEDLIYINGGSIHPLSAVEYAKSMIDGLIGVDDANTNINTNIPDFVSMVWHYGLQAGINVEIYVDGKMSNLEGAFEEYNNAFNFISKHCWEDNKCHICGSKEVFGYCDKCGKPYCNECKLVMEEYGVLLEEVTCPNCGASSDDIVEDGNTLINGNDSEVEAECYQFHCMKCSYKF